MVGDVHISNLSDVIGISILIVAGLVTILAGGLGHIRGGLMAW